MERCGELGGKIDSNGQIFLRSRRVSGGEM